MKKRNKFLSAIAVGLGIMGGGFSMTGCIGGETELELRVQNGYVQWTEDGENWADLIPIDDLKGEQGLQGVAGKQVEFQVTSTHIQWRYVGDSTWNNLVALEDIKGDDLMAEECTITYDFNLGEGYGSIINNELLNAFDREGYTKTVADIVGNKLILEYTQTSEKGDYFDLYDMKSIGLGNYFLGWYVDDIKVNKLNIVGGDVELTAKWSKDIAEWCTTDLFGHSFKNLDKDEFTVSCYPSQNDVQLCPRELYLKDGIFYTVDFVSSRGYTGEGIAAKEVCLPDSVSEWNLEGLLDYPEIGGSHTIFRSYHSITSDLQSSNITVYQVKNYACIQHDRIQFCYKIDFETREARLGSLHCYGNGRIQYGQYYDDIDEKFNVYDENGELVEITVTSIKNNWMSLYYDSLLEDDAKYRLDKITTFEFIVGEDVDFIGTPRTGDFPEDYSKALGKTADIVIKYFSKRKYDENNLVECNEKLYVPINIVYYYVENEEDVPRDGGNYWHYGEDGKTPIVWENNTTAE